MFFYRIVFYVVLFMGFVPMLLLLLKQKPLNKIPPVAPFVGVTAIGSLYEFVGTRILQLDTAYWFQVYPLLEFLSLFYFFFRVIGNRYKTVFKLYFLLFFISYLFSFFVWEEGQGKFKALIITSTFMRLFVIPLCLLWFKNLLATKNIFNLWENNVFYFVSGFIFYYAFTFPLFLLSNSLLKNQLYLYDFWWINILAVFVLRLSLIVGVFKSN